MSTENTQDIENQQTFGQITAPPQFITDFYKGGLPGVPGLVPMANQFFLNQLYGMAEGQTPFDYGSRIADFTPAERKAFDMTYDRMGSYKPFSSVLLPSSVLFKVGVALGALISAVSLSKP